MNKQMIPVDQNHPKDQNLTFCEKLFSFNLFKMHQAAQILTK